MIKKLLIILFLCFNYLNSNEIDYTMSYIYEKNKFLNIEDILNSQYTFTKFNLNTPLLFGYNINNNVLVKLTLQNNSNKSINKLLVSKNPLVSQIVFYDSKGKTLDIKGVLREYKYRVLYSTFSLTLKPYEKKEYYFSFSSPQTTLLINLDIMDKFQYDNWYSQNILYIALFFGAMLALCLYNLFVFFATKDKAYLFYTLCILATTFHHSAYTGILFLFTNIEYTLLTFKYSAIIVSLPMYFLGLFSKYYLDIKSFKKINLTINSFLILIPISWIFFIVFPEFSKLRNLLSFLFLFYLFLIAIYLAYNKIQQSYYIIVGWFLFFLSAMFMVLSSSGTYHIFDSYPYIVEVLLFSEAILFSIALSNRIRSLQNQIITLQEKKEKELQFEVAEKTKRLSKSLKEKQLLLQELSHRVKNNMQMILSLIRLQSLNSNSEELKNTLMTIEGRIGALGNLHELLYKQDNINSIKANEYFELLINDLTYGHQIDTKKIHFSFDLKGSVLVSHAIYCGLIINELVTNSLKYAFKDDIGEIKVFFEEQNDNYMLKYSDNGIGHKFSNDSDSLGMMIINSLAEDQLEGELKIDGKSGINLSLIWSKELKDE